LLEQVIKSLRVTSDEVRKAMSDDLELLVPKVYEVIKDEQNSQSLQCVKNEEKVWEYRLNENHQRDAQLVIMFEAGMICPLFSSLRGALK